MRHAVACLVALAVTGFSPAAAQTAEAVREALQVTVVEIPVHVIDRDGNPVRGLTASNFEIFDERKKRSVTHFEVIDLMLPQTQAQRERPVHPAARRNFLLLFDLSYSVPGTLERARQAAREFLDSGISKQDLAAIATFGVEEGFRLLANFSADRELLRKGIESVGTSKQFRAADPLLISFIFEPLAPGQTRTDRDQLFYDQMKDMITPGQTGVDEIQRARIRHQLITFGRLAQALDQIRGTKQVILLSEGFDAKLLKGRDPGVSQESNEEALAQLFGQIWTIDNDKRFGNTAALEVLKQMGELFRRSDVVLHSFDIRGVRPPIDARGGALVSENETLFGRAVSEESLFLLADPTGGRVFKHENDMSENFQRLLKQQEVTYILGFQISETKSPGTFHEVDVRLRGVPGARAYHRAGYSEEAPQLTALERVFTLAEIFTKDIPQEDLTIATLAVPFPRAAGPADVPVIVEIDGDSILRNSTDDLFSADVYVYAFDGDSRVADFLYQRFSLDIRKLRQRLSERGVKFVGSLRVPPGRYVVKTLVRSETSGVNGYRRIDLHVPDASARMWFPLMVDRPSDWVLVRGTEREPAGEYPFQFDRQSFVPAAAPALSGSEEQQIVVFTSGEAGDLMARVISEKGAAHAADLTLLAKKTDTEAGQNILLFRFVPGDLKPGSYVLELARGTHEQATLPFVVN